MNLCKIKPFYNKMLQLLKSVKQLKNTLNIGKIRMKQKTSNKNLTENQLNMKLNLMSKKNQKLLQTNWLMQKLLI